MKSLGSPASKKNHNSKMKSVPPTPHKKPEALGACNSSPGFQFEF
jgi:hypothetical protein